uniref:Uncharacterized protein n=1 Tax=Ditylenchus dipsaci TaxID=166011 RepID=A0A915DWF6_9BILA
MCLSDAFQAFATWNIAANFLDNPFFKELLNKMRPSYKIPSRMYTFPKVLIPAEFERVKSNLKQTTGKADFLALSSDGLSDINR